MYINPLTKTDRRCNPRIKQQIPLKIRLDDYDLVGHTHDISCLGTYCTINKYLAPFSIVSIILLLPLTQNNKKTICNVQCQGVIVRTETDPANNKQYNTAIYFNRLKQSERLKLLRYVQQYL